MILYHVVSTYQLLNAIVHKIRRYPNEEGTLLIATALVDKHKNYKALNKVFKNVIVCEYYDSFSQNADESAARAVKDFESFLKTANLNLRHYREIHCFCVHRRFGIYLTEKKIPFVFWEDAAGILNNPQIIDNIHRNNNPVFADYCNQKGLFNGINENVIKRVCNVSAQNFREIPNDVEDFNIIKEIGELTSDSLTQLIEFFVPYGKISVPKNATLILTEHFANLKRLSFEHQILIYQMFVDYFFPGDKIVIKPHPDDIIYYSQIFPNATVIREIFPAELLPFIFTNQPMRVATIASAAARSLACSFSEMFSLDNLFEKMFEATHRYYTALKIINLLFGNNAKICEIGSNHLLLVRLMELQDFCFIPNIIQKLESTKSFEVLIIDDFFDETYVDGFDIINALENSPPNCVIIILNSKQDFRFYDINHKTLWDNIVAVPIKKRKFDNFSEDDFYANINEEIIYVYSTDEKIRKRVRSMEFEKDLKNTGIEISVTPMTDEQHKIKVLEGILEATEKRLLYYINLFKKYEETK